MSATIDHPPLSPAEIKSIYLAILSRTTGSNRAEREVRAKDGLEAYLAGRMGMNPRGVNRP